MNKQEIEKLKKKFPDNAFSEGVDVPPASHPWMGRQDESDFEDDAVPDESVLEEEDIPSDEDEEQK